jgi:hypothetical protein
MTPGTYVQAPIRKIPVAYMPGKVVRPHPHGFRTNMVLVEMRHPTRGNGIYQYFDAADLIATRDAIATFNRQAV